jgi:hypothetical protein
MIVHRWVVLVFVFAFCGGLLSGCGHDARLVRDTTTGGLVSYPFQTEADILSSDGRRDAFRLIRDKCPQGSRLLKEGELPKVSQSADRLWRGQMGTDRIWGIQFACETAASH